MQNQKQRPVNYWGQDDSFGDPDETRHPVVNGEPDAIGGGTFLLDLACPGGFALRRHTA